MREKEGEHFIETLSNVLSDYLNLFMLAFLHLRGGGGEGEVRNREERGTLVMQRAM